MQENYPFDSEFQKAIAKLALSDSACGIRITKLIDPTRLTDTWSQWVIRFAADYVRKYHAAPTPLAIRQRCRRAVTDGEMTLEEHGTIDEAIDDIMTLPMPEPRFVMDEVILQARIIAIGDALDDANILYGRGDIDGAVNTIVKADGIGRVDSDLGTDLVRHVKQRAQHRTNSNVKRFPIGVPAVDEEIEGGLAAGEMGVIIGAPGGGKSMALVHIAVTHMMMGGRVLYYTLEGSEELIFNRIDANISGVAIRLLPQFRDKIVSVVENSLPKGATIVVKKFPANVTTIRDIDVHIREVRAEFGISPTMIVVDYGDILGSEDEADNTYHKHGNVYGDISALAFRHKVPVWTASQITREAVAKKVVTISDIAESMKKTHIADLIIALVQQQADVEKQELYLYLAKVRFAESRRRIGPFRTGFAHGSFIARDDIKNSGMAGVTFTSALTDSRDAKQGSLI